MSELTPRGVLSCRGCGAHDLVSVLDLGAQPLSNEMGSSAEVPDPTFPLHLRVCGSCGLGQIGEYVLPERIFGSEYPYLSSVSTSWVAHARRYVEAVHAELALGGDDLVVEIASNDGYLLEQVQSRGVRVLGVEPAGGVADLARAKGVPTVSEFFGSALAGQLVAEHGRPRLVVANNVMAHVPDLHDFVAGLALLCDEQTVVTVENPSFLTLLRQTQFDTIYHEHFSYLTAHAVARVVAPCGLELVRVDHLPTHGGSNRYWLAPTGCRPIDASAGATIDAETSAGLLSPELWEAFATRSQAAVQGLRAWLDERHRIGRTVMGYGAAAKGNTLLNAAGAGPGDLRAVVDRSPHKQGRFLPGSKIPVVAPAEPTGRSADDVLILPWNLAAELVDLVRAELPGADPWVAVPSMRSLR